MSTWEGSIIRGDNSLIVIDLLAELLSLRLHIDVDIAERDISNACKFFNYESFSTSNFKNHYLNKSKY